MEEAEKLCNRVAIIDNGKIKVSGTNEQLKNALGGDVIAISTTKTTELSNRLSELNMIPKDVTKNVLRLTVTEAEKLVPRLVEIARSIDVQIDSISVHRPTLNDVFLHYTGHEIRTEEAESMMRAHARSMRRGR